MKILACIGILGLILSTKAVPNEMPSEKARINLNYCSSTAQTGVDYFFSSCVNTNFSTIGQNIGGFYSYCTNFGSGVDYFYIYCINANFRDVERNLQNRVYLQDCQNYDRTRLEYFFISCVNNNFNQIQRAINFP